MFFFKRRSVLIKKFFHFFFSFLDLGDLLRLPFHFTKKGVVGCLTRLVFRDVLQKIQISKKTQNGISLVDFNLAVNQGNKTVYVPCVAWRELAETIDKYFKRGQMCVIIGELSSRLITTTRDTLTDLKDIQK